MSLRIFSVISLGIVLVAVGTEVTSCPPHRSGRALLTHPAPTLGEWRKSAVPDKGGLSLA